MGVAVDEVVVSVCVPIGEDVVATEGVELVMANTVVVSVAELGNGVSAVDSDDAGPRDPVP